MTLSGLELAKKKMSNAGVHQAAIDSFEYFYGLLQDNQDGFIPETEISPLQEVTHLAQIASDEVSSEALAKTVVIKLNGGLGTSMGMQKAKSLLPVRSGDTFLDLIAKQVIELRKTHQVSLPLIFMNSFRTQHDTLEKLADYPQLKVGDLPLDFLQNKEPKLTEEDLMPVSWPKDESLEWCPPGHGDLYPALVASGVLEKLLKAGYKYAFVSNADNLGAVASPQVASWFAKSGASFGMEVARRTAADKKGGHLVVRRSDGRVVLRESAQVSEQDSVAAADIEKHRFFNTNSLWFDLQGLKDNLKRNGGVIPLPLIKNIKTVDPSDKTTPKVIQIESAMGAAIEVFEETAVLEVDRSRFLPVKTTNDLLLLRSDIYELSADFQLRAVNFEPSIDLDSEHYSQISDFEELFENGVPSLGQAQSLKVQGRWKFGNGVKVSGAGILSEPETGQEQLIPAGATITEAGVLNQK